MLAQVLDRFRVEPVEVLGIVLSKQDRRGLGRVLCLQRLDLSPEDLVDLFQRHTVGHRPVGVAPLAIAAVGDRRHAEHHLLAQRSRGLRPDQRCEQDGRRDDDVGDRSDEVVCGERALRLSGSLRRRVGGGVRASRGMGPSSSLATSWRRGAHRIPCARPSSMMIFSGSTSYTQGATFFQPFFILLPWKTLSGSSTVSPSMPSTML